jgi:uncharacterized protein
MGRVLGVFAKAPRAGEVKSRLAAAIGAAAAAKLYDAFLRDLLPRLATIEANRILAFASPADHDFFNSLCGTQFELQVQAGEDLGTRMSVFFQGQFARHATQVVLVGSDSPDLPLDRIEQAFSELARHDVVLGPSDDGGYYLIGMRRFIGELFSRIDWSTPSVFPQTTDRLREIRAGHAVLESWYDVDLPQDLERLNQEIISCCNSQLEHTAAVLREMYLFTRSDAYDRRK